MTSFLNIYYDAFGFVDFAKAPNGILGVDEKPTKMVYTHRRFAKWVNATDFDSVIRWFESIIACQQPIFVLVVLSYNSKRFLARGKPTNAPSGRGIRLAFFYI